MAKGFFNFDNDYPEGIILSESSKTRKPRAKKLEMSFDSCEECGLYKNVKSPKMKWSGEGKLNTLMIAQSPGAIEDIEGTQLVGDAGQVLRKHLFDMRFDLDADFWKINAVNCRTTDIRGNNRIPTQKELKYCRFMWLDTVKKLQPKFIILFGSEACETYFLDRSKPIRRNSSIGRWRNLIIPDPKYNAYVLPLYHPSAVNHNPDIEPIFKKDLQEAMKFIIDNQNSKSPEEIDWDKQIFPLTVTGNQQPTIRSTFNEVEEFLIKIQKDKPIISFDYETSAIRPFKNGHKIWSIGVSIGNKGYAFPFQYPGIWSSKEFNEIKTLWIDILIDPRIKKIAQNIAMEEIWSRILLEVEVAGWIWDTMVTAHILDERPNYTSLDFQTFIYFGYEHGEMITPFKEDSDNSGFNKMHQVPIKELLIHNAKHALFTNLLFRKQSRLLSPKLKEANDLFLKGELALIDIEEAGIAINEKHFKDSKIQLEKRIKFIENKLQSGEEAILYQKVTGEKLLLSSPQQLSKLLYDYMGMKPTKPTEKGTSFSVDQSVLEQLDTPFTNLLLKMRKLETIKTRYIEGILKYVADGRIHPNENLHLARTYRSSADSPNLQNIPIRDEEAKTYVRTGIIPSLGNKLLEADYGGVEVCVMACYSQDQVLVKMLNDGGDVHQEWADYLGIERFDAKNAFVFPLFYGSYHENIHTDLVSRGYSDISIRKVQSAERAFWDKYKGIKKFQEWLFDNYKKNVYIEMFHGFRRRGYLTRTEVINSPIQGTGFHCLLWSIIQINEIRRKEEWKSMIVGQVHDSLIVDLVPEEQDHVISIINDVMTNQLTNTYPWIIIPMKTEFEITEIDQPWVLKKEMKV